MVFLALKKFCLKKQFQQLSIYGVGQIFNLVTPLIVVPYLVLICGVENYGKISIGMAVSFFLMVFIDYGTDISAVKDISVQRDNPSQLKTIIATTFGAKAILFLVTTALFSGIIATVPFFNQEHLLFYLGIPILLGQLVNPTGLLQGLEQFTSITVMTIVSKLLYLLLIFTCIQSTSDYIYVNLFWGIANTLAYSIMLLYCLKKHHIAHSDFRISAIKHLLHSNFSLFTSQIFVSLQMYAPVVLLGYFGSNFWAGQYRIVEQILVIFKTYLLLFFNFVYPRICYLVETNRQEAFRYWRTFNGLNFLFIAAAMFVLYTCAEWVVGFFTPTHRAAIAELLQIGIGIPLLMALSVPMKQLVLGFGCQREYTRITLFVVVLTMVNLAIVIPFYQVKGVLYVLLVAELLTAILFYLFLKDRMKRI
jgi:O-antigen/teichoic acid export membrane protein